MEFIMANTPIVVNALSSVAQSLVRDNGSFVLTAKADPVISEALTGEDRGLILESVNTFRSGEAQAIAGSNAVMSASADIASLLKSKAEKVIPFAWFEAVRNNWEGVYAKAQKCEVNVANRAWSRLMEKTDIVKPKADSPKAVAMQKKREEEKAKMVAIPDLKKAMAEAMASGNIEIIPALAKEATRRKVQENQGAIEALKPLKEAIRKQINACNNKALLEKVAKLLPKV
jgi:hypothetical protein